MIWATVSSQSCFCWLYRASPSLAAKNIINLISLLTIWWCPCVESSLVLLEEGVCYDQCVLLAKLYEPFTYFILYSKAKFACYSRDFLTFYFCIPLPYNEKDIFWGGVCSKRSCRPSSDQIRLTPWIAARQASLSITNSRSSLRLTSIESVMPSSHLILCRPLLLLPPIPPSIRVFSNVSTLRMRWPKYWEFQLQHQSFQWTPKTDFL